ncbi:MAG: SPOR domain-containing protein [Nitrosomonas sp.]|nr:SPOR domain-containing protein [Nitrosomonas sp.]MDP1950290.1 SPOR domain-containing protein [Nitrosomonas sp.]
MKVAFILLLIINVVLILTVQSRSDNIQNDAIASAQVNPERIKLLPSHIKCLQWSGFIGTDLLQAEVVIAELELGNQLTQVEMEDVVIHWIYIPPFKNKQDALNEIERINKMGVESYLIQADSQWFNAVSIAIFRDINDARKLLVELKDKGLTSATMSERSLRQAKFLIREPATDISEKIKQQARQFNTSELEITKCERL